jgi:FkbM family methyltransferase
VLDRDSKVVPEPYLSLVVAARNDDHGGNLLGRMQIFVDGWLAQARRYDIPSELIIVEWNPPADRPPLAEALRWSHDGGPCEVRIVTVPRETHGRYAHAANLALYQMIAKNVGIRRARGRFILTTNIDILFSDELAAFLSRKQLRPDRMYRIDRHDAMSDVPAGAPVEDQLAYCCSHLIRVNRREGTFEVAPDGGPVLSSVDVAPAGSGILFGPGWFPPERFETTGAFRWAQDRAEILLEPSSDSIARLTVDLEPGPATAGRPLDLKVIADDGRQLARVTLDARARLRFTLPSPTPARLEFRAAGAFGAANTNPRTLCFRVFGLERDRAESQSPATLETPSAGKRALLSWRNMQYVIGKLADDGPLVSLTVPVSPRLQRILQNYVHRGGFTGMMRGTKRKEEAAIPAPPIQDVSPRCSDFLHTNGCGDFTLIAREHWFNLRGYPEFDIFSMNIDSVFCLAAHYGGAREEVLAEPMRIYHIEHGSGSGWTPEGQQKLFERIAAKGIPVLDNEDVLQWGAQMRRLNSPMIFNREDWGLTECALPETRPATRVPERPVINAARLLLKPQFHPAFDRIVAYAGPSQPGFEIDFLGVKTRCEFLAGELTTKMLHTIDPGEDSLEWIDVLESILAAKDQFTMMELGAGYGRWSVRAALALRQLRGNLPFRLVAVEGEPRHYRWLQQHMSDNSIPPDACTLIQGVVSDHRDDVLFYVGSPLGDSDESASWYGQAIIHSYESVDRPLTNAYEGQDVVRLKSGWRSVRTQSYILNDILPETERIDLIDLDVQGEELKVIAAAIEALNQRVGRLHIGTHSHEIEAGLRELLLRHGWECKSDYPCAQINETPWGSVQFVDGVQSWVNSKRFPGLSAG